MIIKGTTISIPDDLVVLGDLDLSGTNIEKLPKGLKVDGALFLSDTKIKKLKVAGALFLNGTNIKNLPIDIRVDGI